MQMQQIHILTLGLCLLLSVSSLAWSKQGVSIESLGQGFRAYTLPPGMSFISSSESYIRTDSHQVGEPVQARLLRPVYIGGQEVLGPDTRFYGEVSRLEAPIEGRDAVIAIRFTEIHLANGERLPISAHVKTGLADHSWGGWITRGTNRKRGAFSIGRVGLYNKSLWGGRRQIGYHYQIEPGETWHLVLEKPVKIVLPSQ